MTSPEVKADMAILEVALLARDGRATADDVFLAIERVAGALPEDVARREALRGFARRMMLCAPPDASVAAAAGARLLDFLASREEGAAA